MWRFSTTLRGYRYPAVATVQQAQIVSGPKRFCGLGACEDVMLGQAQNHEINILDYGQKLVGGLEHFLFFPCIGNNHPN